MMKKKIKKKNFRKNKKRKHNYLLSIFQIFDNKNNKFKFLKLLCIFILTIFYYYNSYNKGNQISLLSKNNYIDTNSNILEPYIKEQKDFCENPNKYINKEIEDNIMTSEVHINGINYPLIVPKRKRGMTLILLLNKQFEGKESMNIYNALNYYKNRKNIVNNKDIVMLDIGGHLGWYPSFLGRYGYTILTFEPSPPNYYLSKKNYCLLNQKSNVVIITKGLNNEDKICNYYKDNRSNLNGMTSCNNEIKDIELSKHFKKIGNIVLTKLNNFIPYLRDKNIALMKIDVEGSEGKVIEGGLELITKYHVPFIFIEFTPIFLKEHDTDPRQFIQLFVDNGYKISLKGFLSNNFISPDELLEKTKFQINTYFIYKDFVQ